jgi:hypothetical protein
LLFDSDMRCYQPLPTYAFWSTIGVVFVLWMCVFFIIVLWMCCWRFLWSWMVSDICLKETESVLVE